MHGCKVLFRNEDRRSVVVPLQRPSRYVELATFQNVES